MFIRDGYIRPFVLQVLGMLLLVAFGVVWLVSGKQSGLLVGAAITLTLVGSASGAVITIRQDIAKQDVDPPKRKTTRKRTPRS